MKVGTIIPVTVIIIMITLGSILTSQGGTIESVDAQTNVTTTNETTSTPTMTTTAEEEASRSIRGAVTETGEFLGNVTEKVVTSKSAESIVNETSDVLGNATVGAKQFFNPNN